MNEYAIICGLSGAGRSTAADVLEDQGWFVIDNLPVALIPDVAGDGDAVTTSGNSRVALVVGASSDPRELTAMLSDLRASGARVRTLFLDARTEVLVRRFESTRRRHPVSAGALLEAAIEREREGLQMVRAEADAIVDTSDLNVHELSRRVGDIFGDHADTPGMQVTVTSFGYKHGMPVDGWSRCWCCWPRPMRPRARRTSRWRSAAPGAGTGRWRSPRRWRSAWPTTGCTPGSPTATWTATADAGRRPGVFRRCFRVSTRFQSEPGESLAAWDPAPRDHP